MIALTIYSRPGCHLCDDMKALVARVIASRNAANPTGAAATVTEIDISDNAELAALYGLEIPVLMVNGRKAAKFRVTEKELTRMLDAAGEAGQAGPGAAGEAGEAGRTR